LGYFQPITLKEQSFANADSFKFLGPA